MSNHSLKSELELLKLPPVKRELATATPNAYQSYKNPDMARLEKSKEKYIPPHVEYKYKFTTKVTKPYKFHNIYSFSKYSQSICAVGRTNPRCQKATLLEETKLHRTI